MRLLAVILALTAVACDGDGDGTEPPRILVDLDVPAEDGEGMLLDDLESLEFRVSDGRDFVAAQLYRIDELPAQLTLPDVPTGENILFDLTGLADRAEVAYGRTCRLSVSQPEEGGDEEPLSALLYFSRVGRFRAGDQPLEPARRAGLMFADDQGRAIVTGGSEDTRVELFDPRVGEFSQFSQAGEVVTRLAGAVAVRGDGSAILAGGQDPAGALVGAVEKIDPGSAAEDERIVTLGPERQAEAERTGLALAALPDASVLLTGGRDTALAISGEVALLEEGDDQFRPTATLIQPRTGHTASVGLGLGGVAYLIGGLSPGEVKGTEVALGTIELYRPQDQSVRPIAAALAAPRFGHSATVLLDGRILIVGGKTPRAEPCDVDPGPETCFDAVAAVELFDPILGEVRQVASEDFGPVYDHTATPLEGGRVLIAGGRDGNHEPRGDAWLFDPQLEALVPTRALSRARARHAATELCDGTVLLVGGGADGEEPPPSERYSPASERLP